VNSVTYEARKRLVEIAQSMLQGALPFIEGAQMIDGYFAAAGVDRFDEDSVPFMVVASETDRFPIGRVRQYWEPKALEQLQPEIDAAEKWAREATASHCQRLVDTFGPTAVRQEIGQVAHAMLAGKVSFIKGAHQVAFLQPYADLPEFDVDFIELNRIHLAYPSLPPTDGRENWAPEVLQKKYPEIRRAEAEARQALASDCQKLIDRFL